MASIVTQLGSTHSTTNHYRFRLIAGIPLLLGIALSVLGVAFDAQWHVDVGPDTFFTLPHAVWYSAVAIAGLTSLAVVLWSTWSYQRRQSIFPEKSLTFIWPVFRAPLSFVITGIGSALFILMGVFDLVWHGTFGFDVTPVSPPHQGLFFAIILNMIGTIGVFGSTVNRGTATNTETSSKKSSIATMVGLSAATAITLCYTPLIAYLSMFIPLDNAFSITVAGLFTIGLIMVSSATGRVGAATLTGLFVLLFRTTAWYITPWATATYAASLGLFIRDDPSEFPPMTEDIPMFMFVVGLVFDVLLYFLKRRNAPVKPSVIGLGSLTCLLLVLPIQFVWSEWEWQNMAITTPFIALALGALLGWVAWKLGAVLREGAR